MKTLFIPTFFALALTLSFQSAADVFPVYSPPCGCTSISPPSLVPTIRVYPTPKVVVPQPVVVAKPAR